MNQGIFEKLGLSPNEAKIYSCLLEYGESGVSTISSQAGIHRRNVYDAISRLVDKGLVQQSLDTKENTYAPVDPQKLTELVAEQSDMLSDIMPSLMKQFEHSKPQQRSYIVKGHEGLKIIWKEMIKEKQDVFGFGVKGQWFDPELDNARKQFFNGLGKNDVTVVSLADHDLLEKNPKFLSNYPYKKIKMRMLPAEYDTNSLINICGDYVIMYNQVEYMKISRATTFYVIRDRDLAETYRKWFWFMWEMSKDIK